MEIQKNKKELESQKQLIISNLDIEQGKYPNSIVWTTLPCISCICPGIGHMGIGDSQGLIHDFAGSQFIGIDDFAFGKPLKYVTLDQKQFSSQQIDQAIQMSDQKFVQMNHNLCSNNCHSHVAEVLNQLKYENKTNWNMVNLCCYSVLKGKYVNCSSLTKTYFGPLVFFLVIASLIVFFFHLNQRD